VYLTLDMLEVREMLDRFVIDMGTIVPNLGTAICFII
jgi:hypothetical protein